MIVSTWFSVAAFLVAALAGGLASLLLVRRGNSASHRGLAGLLGATALTHLANGLGLFDEAHALQWRRMAFAAELIQPAALLYVGFAFLDPAARGEDSSPLRRARTVGVGGLLLAMLTVTDQVFVWRTFDDGMSMIALASWGRVPYVFMVIAMALGLAQLELVLRASREPVRHRLKFIVIGMGGLAGYQLYQASQMLLLPIWRAEHILVSSVVTAMALCLIAYGLGRSRLQEVLVKTYVSQQALFGSVTFIVIGLYLFTIGVVGEWIRRTNQPLGVGFSVVVMFGGLVGLAVAAFSKTVRAEIRQFLARNFYRSKYDYRAKWLQVTEAFQEAANREAIMDRLLDFLIKTFATATISIWTFRDADRRFCQARSVTAEKEPSPLDLSHPVIMQLLERDEPVWLEGGVVGRNTGADAPDDPLAAIGAALCFPIRAQGQLTAFVALGKQLRGEAYGTDDCDLLHGIAHHVGALLSHADLAEERQAAAELEALHRFSVFCLHDLKNLAARLSLVAQNAESHGKDPAFQESAMRTVADTADKMTVLMSKLSLKSFKPMPVAMPEPIDMPSLIDETVAPIRGEGRVGLYVTSEFVPPVMAVREHIHQVLLNVVLNAKQAISQDGAICITTGQQGGLVVVTVEDTGVGIPASQLSALFRPSQSSRPGGLGIGLYQCKQMVEAHQGTIQLRSEEGKGTQVRIALPIYHPPAPLGKESIIRSGRHS